MITFAQFLRDPALSGPDFQAASWAPWHCLAKILSGEQLSRSEAGLLKRCAGITRLPKSVRTLILLCGRRAGKSKFLSAVAVWIALFAADWKSILSRGERGVVLLLAVDKKQAAILSRYAAGLCEADLIAPEVTRLTAEEIEFSTGAVIEIGTNDHRSVRGRTCLAVIGDEACLWASEGESLASDEEVVAAAEPSMASVPGGGWLLLSSSPYRPKGLMHRKWRELWGNASARGSLCWVAASRVMNPSLPEAFVKAKLAEDPVRAKCEYLAEWRSTDADFVPADVIEACTDWRVRERPPIPGVRYFGFVDMAGGTGADSAAIGVGHAEGEQLVLDCLRERRPRFVPSVVVREHAELLASYGLRECTGDAWSGGLVRDEYAKNSVTYRTSPLSRSEIYLTALPLLLSGRARLLDNERLRTQLSGLERREHAGGRETVDHSRGAAHHDDLCNAALGALALLKRAAPPMTITSSALARLGRSSRLNPALARI